MKKYYTMHKEGRFFISEKHIAYLLFFSLGFGYLYGYLVSAFAYFLFKILTLRKQTFKYSFLLLLFLYSTFLYLLLFIGYNRLVMYKPIITITLMVFVFFAGGVALQSKESEVQLKMIKVFIFGLFIKTILVVVYSYFKDPIVYGYGLLYNPISKQEVNSPSYSNNLAIIFSFFYYMLFYMKNKFIKKLLYLSILIISVLFAIWLGGRTFFIVVSFAILLLIMFNFKIKSIFKYVLAGVFILISLYAIIDYLGLYTLLDNSVFVKRVVILGIESPRFQLLSQGLNDMIYHPFGGFVVNISNYEGDWFHNIFLDTARVGGYIPVLLLLILFIYPLKSILYRHRNQEYKIFLTLYFVILLLFQQDVVLEGNNFMIVLFFFISLALINTKKIIRKT